MTGPIIDLTPEQPEPLAAGPVHVIADGGLDDALSVLVGLHVPLP